MVHLTAELTRHIGLTRFHLAPQFLLCFTQTGLKRSGEISLRKSWPKYENDLQYDNCNQEREG
jgi:hypothetical protein